LLVGKKFNYSHIRARGYVQMDCHAQMPIAMTKVTLR